MLSKPLHSVVIFILIHVVLFSIFRDLYLSRSPYHTAYSLLDLCLFQHSEMENVCSGYMNIKMLSWLLTDFDGGAEYTVSIPRSKIARISQVFSYFFFRSRTYYYLGFVGSQIYGSGACFWSQQHLHAICKESRVLFQLHIHTIYVTC